MEGVYDIDFEKIVNLSLLSDEDWYQMIKTKYSRIFNGQSTVKDENISNEEFEMLQGYMLEKFNQNIQSLIENTLIGNQDLVQQSEQKLISLLLLNDKINHISFSNSKEHRGFANSESEASIKQLLNIIFYTDNCFLLEKTFQLISQLNTSKVTLRQIKNLFKQFIGTNEIVITDLEANIFTSQFYQSLNPFNYLKSFILGETDQSQGGHFADSQNFIYIIHRKKIVLNINVDVVCGKQSFQNNQNTILGNQGSNTSNQGSNPSNQRISQLSNLRIQDAYSYQFLNYHTQQLQKDVSASSQQGINNEFQSNERKHKQNMIYPSYYLAKQILGQDAEIQDVFRVAFVIKLLRKKDCIRSLLTLMLSYFTVFSERKELGMNIDLVQIIKNDFSCLVPCLLFSLLDDACNIKRETKSQFQALVCSTEYQQSLSSSDMQRFIIHTIETDKNCFKYIEHDVNINLLPPYIRSYYSLQRTHKKLMQCETADLFTIKFHEYLFNAVATLESDIDQRVLLHQDQLECIDAISSYFTSSDLSKLLQVHMLLPEFFYEEKKKEEEKRRRKGQLVKEDINQQFQFDFEQFTFGYHIKKKFHKLPGLVKFYLALFLSEVAPKFYLNIIQSNIKQPDNLEDIENILTENLSEKNQQSIFPIHSDDISCSDKYIDFKEIEEVTTDYKKEIQKQEMIHPIFDMTFSDLQNHLASIAKQAKMSIGNSFILFRKTNNLLVNYKFSYYQILNQSIVLQKIVTHKSREFRQKALPIVEKIIQNHSNIYEDMKKRISKLQVWEISLLHHLASFNNDLLETSDDKVEEYLEKEISAFQANQDEKQLVPLLLFSCKIFQKTSLNDPKDEIIPVKERIFYIHLQEYPEFCKIYYLLNVKYKGHLRTLWNFYSNKHPELLIKEICILNFVRLSSESAILNHNELNESQKKYFLFLKKNIHLFQQIPKDLDLRLSIIHYDLHKSYEFKYIKDFYLFSCLLYMVMSQSEFSQSQKQNLLISFFQSLNKIKDFSSFSSLLLNKKLYDNVSKIIQNQPQPNKDLLVIILNIMNNTVHQSICEFKINLLVLIDFKEIIQKQKSKDLQDNIKKQKELFSLIGYLDLVFYDALLSVEKDKRQRFLFDETDYEKISDNWNKIINDICYLQEELSLFKKNKISLIYHKFQVLKNQYQFKIVDLKDQDYSQQLNKYRETFNFSDFYPQFKNKFDALTYYGILVKNLVANSPVYDFQIIKNTAQYIIDQIEETNTDNLIQLSHILKNVTNILCSKLPFDFKNLEVLIDIEKQIQKNLKNDQKQIMSFNDQITSFLDNVKEITFSEQMNSDFLKVNLELKLKKLFYLESEQKIKKQIQQKEIQCFLDNKYGQSVLKFILKSFPNQNELVELAQPLDFDKIQTISSNSECKKSLQECNSITTKLMEWMVYFQEYSKTSDSAKKTIISLFEVLKIICEEYPLAVQHIVASNFHVKLLDITHSLQHHMFQKRKLSNGNHSNFSPFLLNQDYAFYKISTENYISSSLCIKNHLIQHLIQIFQQQCLDFLQSIKEGKQEQNDELYESQQNKSLYIQNQIIELLVDIPKNVSQPIAHQILINCEYLFLNYTDIFFHLNALIKLFHITLNFLLQSFYADPLLNPQNLLKLRFLQFLNFNQSFKDKEEVFRKRQQLSQNKIENHLNLYKLQNLPFLESDQFSKPSDNYLHSDIDEKNEESKIQDFNIQHNQQNQYEINQHIDVVYIPNYQNFQLDEGYTVHNNSEVDQVDNKYNFNFDYDLKNAIKQSSNSQNLQMTSVEKSKIEKCIQEILLKFPVFDSCFFEKIFQNSQSHKNQSLNQLLISLMNHPWNCMEILNIVFRQSFQEKSVGQGVNIQYNQIVETALKTSLIHYPLSKGVYCKKENQIILGEHNPQIDLTHNIFEMEQIPLIQVLLRSPQFSRIQEHVWMIIKNDINAEFPNIYQNVVITQNLIDMVAINITSEKLPQLMINIIQNQVQIIDIIKFLTPHLEETTNSSFIYYSLFALRKTLEKFISELSHDSDVTPIINSTLSQLREWIIGRSEFVEKQLTNMLKKCTQFIQDQVSKFYSMRPEQLDDIEIDLENVSKNFQVLWKIITNIKKDIKMDIQALAEINLILNYAFLETGQLPIMRQRKQSNEVSLTRSFQDKNEFQQSTNIYQYHSEDEFSEDFLISKLASMNELTKKSVNFERKLWEFFEQISETLGPEIIGRDVYIHLLNLLKPSLKKSELMRHLRSIVYGNQFTFAKQTRQINIFRDNIWTSTVEEMKEYTTDEWLRAVFSIKFKSKVGDHIIDEIGIDAGGLKNHWISKVVEQTFLNNKELFTFTPNQMSVYPNKDAISKKALEQIELLGKFVGKSMMEDWSLMLSFAPFFIKSVLKRDLSIGDFYSYDFNSAQQHQWLLENDINGLDLGITFSYISYSNGASKVIELKNDGQNIEVNDQNKKEYIQLYCKAKMQDEIALQTQYFQKGLFSIIPEDALEALEPDDFISFYQGVQEIDIQYLKKKMKYEGFKSTDKIIEWFWEILKDWDNVQKKKFLSALTEIPGIPVGGYPVRDVSTGNVKQLTISFLNCNPESLPVWHTCFFRVDIPKYNSKEQMKQKIEQSINLSCGFHIA
ncbi:HECT domain ubiquitin transferase (macronuclear) [Tetrahymena thermophila SB210]|uniref:HECT-type E3 ubiquitin transferase n=1 Tax=Tetrahymena thermophila (strain SB210) TaxID=312017 RepID=Q247X9_TETTS|nr:HECT domain ubiquitin transferase [Tetrahymena thermophila SB210]EAS04166.2 HECT domain ubiquitin transferase [Tetrahymena thermophila SB210]|eukprot:XP_001024411.2 HECT domain ubiquitin transferase [Tetrahymena thermophila SB210]